ncbi:sulfite reductase [NADPH] flavoprotein component, partial [Cryomyces antarcticus]
DEALEKKLNVSVRKALASRKIQLFVLDPSASARVAQDHSLETYLTQLAFLRIARYDTFSASVQKLADINGGHNLFGELKKDLQNALRQIEIPESWLTIEPEVEPTELPADIDLNSFVAFDRIEPEPPTLLKTW